jgi:Tol biopolymer transport system component
MAGAGSANAAGSGGQANGNSSGAGQAGASTTGGQAGNPGGAGQAGGGQGGTAPCQNFGPWLEPEPVVGLAEDTADHWGPSLTNAPTVLFYSIGVGEAENIWRATRTDLDQPFTAAMAVAQVNTEAMDGTPFIMPDGQGLWFSSTRPGGLGDRDIWMAPGGVNGFAPAINVGEVNTEGLEHLPSLTADGLILVFGSTRVDSANEDIFMATRDVATDPFSTPFFVGELNTDAYDGSPAITPDGLTIYLASKRIGNDANGTDIFVATRESRDDAFSEPQEIVELNTTSNDEDPRLSPAGNEIFFASNRDTGTHQIWHALRECAD